MISWIISNIDTICEALTTLIAACTAIAGLTPTKKDDGVVATIVKIADQFSIVNTKKDREKLAE